MRIHLTAWAIVVAGLSMMLEAPAASAQTAARGGPGDIAVVVGPESRIRSVDGDDLRELFLRRRRSLSDGGRVTPINLTVDNPVRRLFSKLVLGRFPEDLASYWDKLYYQGIAPPAVVSSPAAVCEYVARDELAIGYVPADAVGDACRVIFVLRR